MTLNPLKEAFSKAIEETEELFNEFNFERMYKHQFPAKGIIEAWRGIIKCGEKDVCIIVALTSSFPDDLPRIYLTKDFKYLPIPHVDDNNFLCTFDTDNIDFFAEKTVSLVRETIEKARGIIADGIAGKNSQDFENEFLAYWPIGTKWKRIYSILQPINKITEIEIARIESSVDDFRYIIGNNEDDIRSYLRKLHAGVRVVELKKCLFLPLQQIPKPPFPKNNSEIFEYLKNINPAYEKAISNFLFKNEYCGTIIFSVTIKGEIGLASWEHISPGEKYLMKGFRPGKVSRNVLRARLASQKITRCNVERIDGERIQKRIGHNKQKLRKRKVCIIGCGSLGSNIAFHLSRAGVEKFILIDNDELLPENVARHLCGMSEVNQGKVYAVAKKIESHFPYIQIDSYFDSFHKVFTDKSDEIYSSDLIISATANTSIERRLNQIQISSTDFPPVLYSWIEPYGIASHAVLILKGNGGCFECCLDQGTLRYLFSIAEFDQDKFTIQEAGCQTSFTPYSALEANQASSIATRLCLAYLNDEILTSTRLTWIGDLNIMENMHIKKNSFYEHATSLSLQTAKIDKCENCLVCRQ